MPNAPLASPSSNPPSNPLVSIIISNYNYAKFLRTAIDSALQQTYSNIETIVIDDGSTDDSHDLIASYGDQIIAFLKTNGGHASTFNAGFAASQGQVICFLDADDFFEPDKVEKVVETLNHFPQIGWVFNALKLFDTQTNETLGVTRAFPSQAKDQSDYCDFRQSIRQGQLNFYPPSTSGLCFKRDLLSKILPLPEALQIAADRYLVNAAIILSPGYFFQAPLTHQGIHDNNAVTLKTNLIAQQKSGRNEMVTAYFLRAKFPEAWLFSDRTFARGWGSARKYGFISTEASQFKQQYLESVSWPEKAIILLISWYQNRPWKTISLYR
jgi:glycosyltransferase involved in cell wall biosynthesis